MKTMKNRVSALVVALVMMLSLFSVGAMAWEKDEGIDVYWNDKKVGTVTYDDMAAAIKDTADVTYSGRKDGADDVKSYTGKVYTFDQILTAVGVSSKWNDAQDTTLVQFWNDATYNSEFEKSEIKSTKNAYDKDGNLLGAVPFGFMQNEKKGKLYFELLYGQNDFEDENASNFVKFDAKGNTKIIITTPGIKVYWNDKLAGSVSYEQMVDCVSQASKTKKYSGVNRSGSYKAVEGRVFEYSRLLKMVGLEESWKEAPVETRAYFQEYNDTKEVLLSKSALEEKRYYYEQDSETPVGTVDPGFMEMDDSFQLVYGQKNPKEVNRSNWISLLGAGFATVKIYTPYEVISSEGNKSYMFYDDLEDLWKAEGSKKYSYTNINTYPSFETDEFYGPTLSAVLDKAGIDLNALADTDVIRFDSSDGKGADVTVKDIKETRYNFPNGESKNGNKGTTDAQKKDAVEVPYIISVKNGATNLRNVFGQVDPQEQNLSYFIKYINKISVKKDAAKEFTGMTPTIANNSKVKKGDKLNFDLTLPTGIYEGAIYYTVSTDGTEPATPTYSDIFYNFAQNRTDGKDYEDAAKAKLYNMYEFTDAEKTIIKATVYVSGYKPTTTTLTYTKAEESKFTGLANEADKDGNWYYYTDGKIDTNHTGVDQNKYGWWRVENGKVNFKAQGIYQNQYGWWKTTDGEVTFKENSIYQNEFGWWKCKDSKVDFNAQSIYQNKYGWWKTTNGKVTFKENGLFKNQYGTWKVENSKVNFNFNGKYQGKTIKNGKVV